MKAISALLFFLLASGTADACSGLGPYLDHGQTVKAYKEFKKRYEIDNKTIKQYMNVKYGDSGWEVADKPSNEIIHEMRPRISVREHLDDMEITVVHELVTIRRGAQRVVNLFAQYKNLSPQLVEIGLTVPKDYMHHSRVDRFWIITTFNDSNGATKVRLNSTPWEHHVTACGGGNGVVSGNS